MHLRRVVLNNIGPHQHLDVKFELGLVGIWGANGSGKSTILDASYACLTNDWGRFAGVRVDNINAMADRETESSVSVEAEHQGIVFTVSRGLRPESRRLEVRGERDVYTKDVDIRAQLESRLGLNRQLLDEYVFVRQRGMFGFLDETPAKRAESFSQLCRTTRAALAFKACGVVIDSLGTNDVVVESSDDLKAAVASSEAALVEIRKEIARLDWFVLSADDLKKAKARIEKRRLYDWHIANRDRLSQELDEAEEALVSIRSAHAEHAERLSALDRKIAETFKPAAEAAQQSLELWDRFDRWETKVKRSSRELREIQQQEKTYEEPVAPPDGDVPVDVAPAKRAVLQERYEAAKSIVDIFTTDGVVACPTCGTFVKNLGDRITEAQRNVQELPIQIRELTARIKADREYREKLQTYRTEWASYLARRAAVERQHQAIRLEPEPRPDTSRNGLEAAESKYTTALARRKELNDTERLHQRNVDRQEAGLAALKASLAQEEEGLRKNLISDDKLEAAKTFLVEHEAAIEALAPLREQLRTEEAKLTAAKEALLRAKTLKTRFAKRKKAITLLTQLRDQVFHHSKLARVVAEGNLAAVEEDLNDQLALFGSPFRAEVGDGLTFRVIFPGEPPRAAERLSGGQKAVFATAFRPAFASLFGADNGMMALDEPTDGLDGSNLTYMRDALAALAAQVRGRRQVIVITHADLLLPAFDQVIRVGG